jgi:diguanylate cyclase (GGDEF)-like protein
VYKGSAVDNFCLSASLDWPTSHFGCRAVFNIKIRTPYWLLLLLNLIVGLGYAQPLLLSPQTSSVNAKAYLQLLADPNMAFSLEQVQSPKWASRFQPIENKGGDLNLGYSSGSYWLKLELQQLESQATDWLIEVDFPSLDQMSLYIPSQNYQLTLGDLLPFNQRPIPNRNLLFPVHLTNTQPVTLYFYVHSEGTLTLPIKVWQQTAFYDHNQSVYAGLFLYYGMLLALGLYNLMLFLSLRDPLYLAYVGFVISMGIGQMSLYGIGNQYLWPDWLTWGNIAASSGFAAAGLFGGLFTRLFLMTPETTPKLDKLLLVVIGCFCLSIALPLLSYQIAAITTSLLGIVFAITAEVAAAICWHRRRPSAHWFILAWTLFLLGVVINSLRNLGWLPTNFFTHHAMQLGSALEMLLLSFALAERIDGFRKQTDLAQKKALATQELMLEHLKASEHQLELRVLERTLELQAMNARLAKSESELSYLARHDPLTGLANRLLLDEYLQQSMQRSLQDQQLLAVILIDLDGFKRVNDRLGHASGDQLLIRVAEQLRQTLRENDTIARIGGDEFVIVAERLKYQDDIADLAYKIIQAVIEASRFLPAELQVTASLGIALHPIQANDSEQLLRLADHAMYESKKSGRNRWTLASK